ncbi:MAG: FAD-binding protein [Micromonosporaceae bacterium]|nr:FAD-binding protein [Micromonosporaceae bacterium]
MTGPRPQNWAGNIEYQAARLVRPASLDELRAVVAAGEPVRALGTGHSFNRIADTTGTLIRLDALQPAIELDESARTVTVPAGARYADIVGPLHAAGYALANLASLPHISVAGSVATGTHGSGDTLRNLAGAVVGLRMVDAAGGLVRLRRGDADFAGAVVSLGTLGIVTDLTLRIEPTFTVAQEVRVGVPLDEISSRWDEVFGAAYSVSAFTTYTDGAANVFLKRRPGGEGTGWSGGRAADTPVHPIPGVDTAACTTQLGVPGPWHERLPHFRPDLVPSAGDELQSEFFVARQAAPGALDALRGIGDQLTPVLLTCELRTIKGDQLWLSPAYGRDTVAFHFTWIRDMPAVRPVVAQVEKALIPLGARPHWGKVTNVDPAEVLSRYPRGADFAALRRRYDPESKFANAYTAALFG